MSDSPKSVRSVTIPDAWNDDEDTLASAPDAPWRIIRAQAPANPATLGRVLLVESYGAGSHLRIARLLQSASRHTIDLIVLDRAHWRSLALTGHRAVIRALRSLAREHYDLLLFSGPADVRLALAGLPRDWRSIPAAVYFHESQWTYPAESLDRIPHLVNHLETLEACDAAWFNSHYHRQVFYASAWNHPSTVVRALARDLLPRHWQKSGVLYPPVHTSDAAPQRDESLAVAWSARWQLEKRPDLMLEIVSALMDAGVPVRLRILGAAPDDWRPFIEADRRLESALSAESGYLPRADYERALAKSDIWLSTAAHEYFGVSAVEAALLGAVPVVPADLAYLETLPSSYTYPPGNADAAAARIAQLYQAGPPKFGPWSIDAARFRLHAVIGSFDDALERLWLSGKAKDYA